MLGTRVAVQDVQDVQGDQHMNTESHTITAQLKSIHTAGRTSCQVIKKSAHT